jgi:hypothetical protein
MIQWPTFDELRMRLQNEYACSYKELHGALSINDGEPETVRYFERTVGDQTRRYTVNFAEDERVAPHLIRSLCDQLGIDKTAFGLVLG